MQPSGQKGAWSAREPYVEPVAHQRSNEFSNTFLGGPRSAKAARWGKHTIPLPLSLSLWASWFVKPASWVIAGGQNTYPKLVDFEIKAKSEQAAI